MGKNENSFRKKLEQLISNGQLKSYQYQQCVIDETDREVDRIVLEFPSGEKLKLSTFCTGFSGGSCFFFDKDSDLE